MLLFLGSCNCNGHLLSGDDECEFADSIVGFSRDITRILGFEREGDVFTFTLNFLLNKDSRFDAGREIFDKYIDRHRDLILTRFKRRQREEHNLNDDVLFAGCKRWFLKMYDQYGLTSMDSDPVEGAWTDSSPMGSLEDELAGEDD